MNIWLVVISWFVVDEIWLVVISWFVVDEIWLVVISWFVVDEIWLVVISWCCRWAYGEDVWVFKIFWLFELRNVRGGGYITLTWQVFPSFCKNRMKFCLLLDFDKKLSLSIDFYILFTTTPGSLNTKCYYIHWV